MARFAWERGRPHAARMAAFHSTQKYDGFLRRMARFAWERGRPHAARMAAFHSTQKHDGFLRRMARFAWERGRPRPHAARTLRQDGRVPQHAKI